MNDLDLVRLMRADAPEPGRDRLAVGRQRLQQAIIPGRRRHRHPVPVIATGAAIAAAAAGVIAVQTTTGTVAHRPAAGRPPTGQSAAAQMPTAKAVLDRAATAAEQRPAVLPGPHQWVYVKGIKLSPAGPLVLESWERFDGQRSADTERGRLVLLPYGPAQDGVPEATPQGAAHYLRSLPTAPAALLESIYQKVDREPRSQWSGGRNATAFETLMNLLFNAPAGVPPAVQAAVYRAVAEIPSVKVGRLLDALGRPAIALAIAPLRGSFLLDPRTYALIGLRDGDAATTRVTVAVVSRPGQR